MYMFYIREYKDKQSVAEYLKSDQLKEDAKRIYGIKTANDKWTINCLKVFVLSWRYCVRAVIVQKPVITLQ